MPRSDRILTFLNKPWNKYKRRKFIKGLNYETDRIGEVIEVCVTFYTCVERNIKKRKGVTRGSKKGVENGLFSVT